MLGELHVQIGRWVGVAMGVAAGGGVSYMWKACADCRMSGDRSPLW